MALKRIIYQMPGQDGWAICNPAPHGRRVLKDGNFKTPFGVLVVAVGSPLSSRVTPEGIAWLQEKGFVESDEDFMAYVHQRSIPSGALNVRELAPEEALPDA